MKKLLVLVLFIPTVFLYGQKPKKFKEIDNSKVNYLVSILPTNDTTRIYNVLFNSFPDLNIAIYEPSNDNVATLLGNIVLYCDTTILVKVLEKGANPNLRVYQNYPGLSVTGPSTDYSKHILLTNINDTAKLKILIRYGANFNIPEIKNALQSNASEKRYDKKYNSFIRRLYGNEVAKDAIYTFILTNPTEFTIPELNDLLANGAHLGFEGLLYYAIDRGVKDDVILELINRGVNVNDPRSNDLYYKMELPIFAAILKNKLEIIKAMVNKGCKLNVLGYHTSYAYSKKPLDYAIALNRTAIADYLFPLSTK